MQAFISAWKADGLDILLCPGTCALLSEQVDSIWALLAGMGLPALGHGESEYLTLVSLA